MKQFIVFLFVQLIGCSCYANFSTSPIALYIKRINNKERSVDLKVSNYLKRKKIPVYREDVKSLLLFAQKAGVKTIAKITIAHWRDFEDREKNKVIERGNSSRRPSIYDRTSRDVPKRKKPKKKVLLTDKYFNNRIAAIYKEYHREIPKQAAQKRDVLLGKELDFIEKQLSRPLEDRMTYSTYLKQEKVKQKAKADKAKRAREFTEKKEKEERKKNAKLIAKYKKVYDSHMKFYNDHKNRIDDVFRNKQVIGELLSNDIYRGVYILYKVKTKANFERLTKPWLMGISYKKMTDSELFALYYLVKYKLKLHTVAAKDLLWGIEGRIAKKKPSGVAVSSIIRVGPPAPPPPPPPAR